MNTSTGNDVGRLGKGKLWLMVLAQKLRDWLDNYVQDGLAPGARSEGPSSAVPSPDQPQYERDVSAPELFNKPGPPEHWLALVREGAPELLTPQEGGREWEAAPEIPGGAEEVPVEPQGIGESELPPALAIAQGEHRPVAATSKKEARKESATVHRPSVGQAASESAEPRESRLAARQPDNFAEAPAKRPQSLQTRLTAVLRGAASAQRTQSSAPKGSTGEAVPLPQQSPRQAKGLVAASSSSGEGTAKRSQSLRTRLAAMLGGTASAQRTQPLARKGSTGQAVPLVSQGEGLEGASSSSLPNELRKTKAAGPQASETPARTSSHSDHKGAGSFRNGSAEAAGNAIRQAADSSQEKVVARLPQEQFSSLAGHIPSPAAGKQPTAETASLGESQTVRRAAAVVPVDQARWPGIAQADPSSAPMNSSAPRPQSDMAAGGEQSNRWSDLEIGADATVSRPVAAGEQPHGFPEALPSQRQTAKRDPWPELPEESLPALGDWARYLQDQQHLHALELEQRGGR